MHNDSLGEVLGIYPRAVLGSVTPLKFLFVLPMNMLYSLTLFLFQCAFSAILQHRYMLSLWQS